MMSHPLIHALGVYGLITFLLYLLNPLLADTPIWVRTLVLVPLMLAGIRFIITPFTSLIASLRSGRANREHAERTLA